MCEGRAAPSSRSQRRFIASHDAAQTASTEKTFASVHFGTAGAVDQARQVTLDAACAAHALTGYEARVESEAGGGRS